MLRANRPIQTARRKDIKIFCPLMSYHPFTDAFT
jgi:hypothetical protein